MSDDTHRPGTGQHAEGSGEGGEAAGTAHGDRGPADPRAARPDDARDAGDARGPWAPPAAPADAVPPAAAPVAWPAPAGEDDEDTPPWALPPTVVPPTKVDLPPADAAAPEDGTAALSLGKQPAPDGATRPDIVANPARTEPGYPGSVPEATPTPAPETPVEGRDPWAAPAGDGGASNADAAARANWAAPAPGSGSAAPAAGPGNPFASPAAGAVPPPPTGPEGPGQVPYGYGYPGAPQPLPGHPGQQGPALGQYPYPGQYPQQGPAGYGYPQPGMMPGPLGQPVWYAPGTGPSNGMGVTAMVLGIVGIVLFCLWPVTPFIGAAAVVLGILGRRKARRGQATNGGQALAGIICGSVAFVIGAAIVTLVVIGASQGSW
ncbi:DUF4190 domain-containing protein [Streptomyces sp. NPDC008150]|uniref:DUF4190 domain-containing protein n=1 Tax=Streptomyces sp. NPDC008150 TaxID=3364816 RepID=UPI0036E59067